MSLVLRQGHLIDPAVAQDSIVDIYIAAGRVVGLDQPPSGFVANRDIDATGHLIVPALVDLAPPHLEERAAWAGGIAHVDTPANFVASSALGYPAAVGPYAFRLGLSGAPLAVETQIVARTIEQSAATGRAAHLGRVSSAASLSLIRAAKQAGLLITCDVSINHLHLTEIDIGFYDTRFRLDPPLRTQRDRDAIREGLQNGTVDAICSDHGYVTAEDKTKPFALARAGATGAELLFSAVLKWAEQDNVDLLTAVSLITTRPSQIALGYSASLTIGSVADLCMLDHGTMWIVNEDKLVSASKYSPFSRMMMPGRVALTVRAGHVVWERSRT